MNFYVYELIDPRDGSVFYVGKGQRSRIKAHEAEARKGKQSPKCEIIRAIWAGGHQVQSRIVKRFKTDIEAYKYEAERIAEIGRDKLTNRRDGGIGGRVKFGAVVLLEEAKNLLWCIKQWAKLGSFAKVSLGALGEIDMIPIIQGYKDRIAEIAKTTGWQPIIEEGERLGIVVEVSHA